MKRLFTLIKNNFITSICFLLSVVMLFSAVAVTYAKYMESETVTAPNSGVGFAGFSAKIDKISALSFTNTAFWGGTAENDNKVAMNALRTVDFSINNFEIVDGKKVVNSVKTSYDLKFTAPHNFVQRLAIQLFDFAGKPIFPQTVLEDIMFCPTGTFTTGEDYSGTPMLDSDGNEVDITYSVTTTGTGDDTVYTATSGDLTITLTPVTKTVEQTIYFRVWDTTELTNAEKPTVSGEGGDLRAPLAVSMNSEVLCYEISIEMKDSFILPAGDATTHSYELSIAPTDALLDEHLGGMIMTKDGAGNYVAVDSIYAGMQAFLVSTDENVVENDYGHVTEAPDRGWHTVIGAVRNFVSNTSYPEAEVFRETAIGNENTVVGAYTNGTATQVDEKYVYYTNSSFNTVASGTNTSYRKQIITFQYTRTHEDRYTYDKITDIDTEQITTGEITTDSNGIVRIPQTVVLGGSTVTAHYEVLKEVTDTMQYTVTYSQRKYGWGWSDISGSVVSTDKTPTIVETVVRAGDPVHYNTSNVDKEEKTVYRTLFRRADVNEITISSATHWIGTNSITNPDSTVTVVDIIESYFQNASTVDDPTTAVIERGPFKTMATVGGVYRQVYYISQCYSKNYPMSVNVTFEQIN